MNAVPAYYFDHNATTPVSPEVFQAMAPLMTQVFGNASSIHQFGQEARRALDRARRSVATMLGAKAEEIVFTSGGTEADNMAIFGAGGHVITTTVEHPAVLQAAAQLPSATFVPVDSRGVVDPEAVRAAIRPDTKLISVMHVNNELGVIQPVHEIARIAHDAGVLFHSDGVQAAGKITLDVKELGVDLYSISAHKIYGPKGMGALYVRKGVDVRPLLYGGPHERKMRAGTENVAGAAGFGRAAEWVIEESAAEAARQATLRDRLQQEILARVAGAHVNGADVPRVGNTSNIRFDGIDSEPLLIALDLKGFAVSSGSACSSGATEPSHVLAAIRLTREQARSSVRFSLGRSNTVDQVDALIDAVVQVVSRLRKLAPAYV
ncbi:MAG TPA: cysteine desulfurase family protein [Bryobacteraceae bacterium]|nr:cysteine desulfurase family protein [Bryobacteraceae bacterium]